MKTSLKRQVLFVDGYNMIGAWPMLNQLKKQEKLGDARDQLLFMLSNYAKYEGIEILVVCGIVLKLHKEFFKFTFGVSCKADRKHSYVIILLYSL